MSSSPTPTHPHSSLPSLNPSHPLELFTVRHGERVDQAFGNDWIDQAFRLHHHHSSVRPRIKKRRQSIITDNQGGYQVIPPASSPSPSPSSSPTPTLNTPTTFTSDYHPHHPPHLPPTLHHATYHRFNLNMPDPYPTHIPRRPIPHFADDSPLTQCGHWQAQTVGSAFRGMRVSVVYVSPALRCVQTAEEMITAMGLKGRRGWGGVRVEPGLFEWMGWYSQHPNFLTPAQLIDNGFSIDSSYSPHSSLPSLHETQLDWYHRSAHLIRRLLSDVTEGNVMVVGHAGSHDVLTYGLLHGVEGPSVSELEMGSRHRLYSNYCGVGRVRWDGVRGGWVVEDDSMFDMHNTANEPYSFQLSYTSVERQRKQREASGVITTPLTIPIDSYTTSAPSDPVPDLLFSRSFGFLLDIIHTTSSYLSSLPSINDADLRSLVQSIADPISSSISPLIPEWQRLSSTCDGVLQAHVIRCFLCVDLLLKSDERVGWQRMSRKDKNVLSWAVLLHDIAKVMKWEAGVGSAIKRDPIHPFTSAVVAARVFARMGFTHGGGKGWEKEVDDWVGLVQSAIIQDEDEGMKGEYSSSLYPLKHDNTQLPTILMHLSHLFGTNTLSSDVVQLVLLHQSIPFIGHYPPAAALDDEEVVRLCDARTVRLLGMLHVVDSGSYQLSNREQQGKYVEEIWDKVMELERLREEGEGQVVVIGEGEGDGEGEGRRGSEGGVGVGVSVRGSLSASERMDLMEGFGPSSSFVLDEDDGSGADAVVLTAEKAKALGLPFPTLTEGDDDNHRR